MASVSFFLSNFDIENHASIFDGEFADESFHIKHTEVGLLGMCKRKAY
jgi:cyclophilin family peptidyl-prolyl cis-trans isomerase